MAYQIALTGRRTKKMNKKLNLNEKVLIKQEKQFGRVVNYSPKYGYLVEDDEGFGKYYQRNALISESEILSQQKKEVKIKCHYI